MTRNLVSAAAIALLMAATPALAEEPAVDKSYITFDRAKQDGMTPDKAFEKLNAGNRRFVEGNMFNRDYQAQAEATAVGQYPFAVVLACLDSRSTPERLFDQGIGDLFVGRVAGNVVDDDMLGSLEFATRLAGAKLIVVMGHTECGAVKGACDGAELGHLTSLLEKIKPAVAATPVAEGAVRDSTNAELVYAVTKLNAELQVRDILKRSSIIRELVDQGELKVIPAMHDISTGQVEFL
ncbi:MAG: carbonic anhydrase family protein [Thiohalocapsa sp.]